MIRSDVVFLKTLLLRHAVIDRPTCSS